MPLEQSRRTAAGCSPSSPARTPRSASRSRLRTGKSRALSTDFERGLVGFDLSADGRTILAHTGGPDPSNQHNVVTVPYGGGEPKVIVEAAAYPDWTR